MWQQTTENQTQQLVKHFTFQNFVKAFQFLTSVAALAESHQHHPYFSCEYNKVTIKLSTHDAADTVTEKDLKLAEAIDHITLNS